MLLFEFGERRGASVSVGTVVCSIMLLLFRGFDCLVRVFREIAYITLLVLLIVHLFSVFYGLCQRKSF
jgi:hypothetical protein